MLHKLPNIIKNSKMKVNYLLTLQPKKLDKEFILKEYRDAPNQLYHMDNIDTILDLLHKGYGGKLDLVYIDPPFFTMANYNNKVNVAYRDGKETIEYVAYSDTWLDFEDYLEMLTIRLLLIKELLSDLGSIYVHIDFRTVHYIKVIMDYIYGADNFLNEIIWGYKSGGTSNKYFSRKHDNILLYTKTNKYIFNPQKEKSYNRGFKPYRFKGVKEYEDSLGWYTLVNLKDVWQIDMVGRTSKERVGYGTQKPEALLERIILTSSNEDSIVADFFAGSGTTLKVADNYNRRWIGSDKGNSSILTISKRLGQNPNSYFIYKDDNINHISSLDINTMNMESVNDKLLLNIELGKYNLNLDSLKLSNKNKEIVYNILNEDSLALIDYIGIGTIKTIPTIFYEDFRTHNKLRVNGSIGIGIPVEFENEVLYIKIIDIFGNETIKSLERMSR